MDRESDAGGSAAAIDLLQRDRQAQVVHFHAAESFRRQDSHQPEVRQSFDNFRRVGLFTIVKIRRGDQYLVGKLSTDLLQFGVSRWKRGAEHRSQTIVDL